MANEKRSPSQLLVDFDAGCIGFSDIDMREVLGEILEDVLESVDIALSNLRGVAPEEAACIYNEVKDYIFNYYGD